ncbi:MAG: hypothetical protein B7X06_00910, partial [Verrucomicrobia bacterium 21-51-4]
MFCHGFAFNARYWDVLRSFFANEHWVLDLQSEMNWPTPEAEVDYIGIGHSRGLNTLIRSPIPFKGLIGLNAFVDFIGRDAALAKLRRRMLQRLIAGFKADPKSTLAHFYEACGVIATPAFHALNPDYLLYALHDLEKPVQCPSIPMLILGAKDDTIVPPRLIHDNFLSHSQVYIEFLETGQHALGQLNAAMV